MQDREANGNLDGKVVSLADWRAARARGDRPALPDPAHGSAISPAQAARLHGAILRLNGAMGELGTAVAQLEFRLHHLRRGFSNAAIRLRAQQRQNEEVLACLESGDIQAMEDCRRRLRAEYARRS